MNIINPYFELKENNIFNIRRNEFSELETNVLEILRATEDIGFTIKDFGIRESKFSSGELCKTIKNNLVIKLQKGTIELDLSMQIPKLIDDNYIIINGRKKIPQFQLFSIPLVTKGNVIKFRNNVVSLSISESRESPWIMISYLGKTLPLVNVIFAYYGIDETIRRFDISNISSNPDSQYEKLIEDISIFYEDNKDVEQDDLYRLIGEYYNPKYNTLVKGQDVIFSLDLLLKTDIMTRKFFKTDSVLEEIVEVLKNPELYDEIDFVNRRIRCCEYLILSKMSKTIFDLCMSNRSSRNPKFNVNSTQILSDCNVSNIVQFDFSINPIDELTKLSRTSLVGPGGFSRENVPEYLRDIEPSMFGRICPVDTPDRENCGVLQNLISNSILDENLKFTDDTVDKQPISIPVSMVPFSDHDDQTRLQMASSQMRQSIMLKNFEQPMIQSGCEGLYSHRTQFVKVAKKNGEVLYVDKTFIIVVYDDKEVEVFDISYRKIYVENLDLLNVYVKQGDKVKAGDILAESNFCKNGKINIGRNLLTAVMVYYGYNYEDGIVISDRLVNEGIFTSVHYIDLSFTIPPDKVLLTLDDKSYKPFPDLYRPLRAGQNYAVMKEVPVTISDYCTIFEEPIDMRLKRDIMMLSELNIYANTWNKDIPEYKEWVENKIEEQKRESESLKKVIMETLPQPQADQFIRDYSINKFSTVGKYKIKSERVNGIYVELFGIYTNKIQLGDKIGNRHGNKGVISKIVPHDKMPQLEDGRHVDICINPLGIISRMNVGQLFELHLAESLNDLKNVILKMLSDGVEQAKVHKYLLDYIKIIDNTIDNWYYEQFKNQIPEEIDENFIKNLTLIQPPFESVTYKKVREALKYTGSKFRSKIFDPVSGKYIKKMIAVGFMYFFRMVHKSESRLAARGIGSYTKRTMQPLAGRKNKGGQRLGEMETACYIAHDATINLHESLSTKSDCIDLKNNFIRNEIDSDLIRDIEENDETPESVKVLTNYLTVIGIDPSDWK